MIGLLKDNSVDPSSARIEEFLAVDFVVSGSNVDGDIHAALSGCFMVFRAHAHEEVGDIPGSTSARLETCLVGAENAES